jgi:hypothetical protein
MSLAFEHVLESSLDADRLWSMLVESFEDSTSSDLWPNELETLHCDSLESGAVVDATYHVGPVDMPQQYRIPMFDAESRRFEYQTGSNHPLEGGGEVSVTETPDGSRLCWSGAYRRRRPVLGLAAALFVEWWFEGRFFGRLEERLRALELRHPRGANPTASPRRGQ